MGRKIAPHDAHGHRHPLVPAHTHPYHPQATAPTTDSQQSMWVANAAACAGVGGSAAKRAAAAGAGEYAGLVPGTAGDDMGSGYPKFEFHEAKPQTVIVRSAFALEQQARRAHKQQVEAEQRVQDSRQDDRRVGYDPAAEHRHQHAPPLHPRTVSNEKSAAATAASAAAAAAVNRDPMADRFIVPPVHGGQAGAPGTFDGPPAGVTSRGYNEQLMTHPQLGAKTCVLPGVGFMAIGPEGGGAPAAHLMQANPDTGRTKADGYRGTRGQELIVSAAPPPMMRGRLPLWCDPRHDSDFKASRNAMHEVPGAVNLFER
jgi:hypothetical protein